MAYTEGSPIKLVIVGGIETVEAVSPAAEEHGLLLVMQRSARGAIGEIGLHGVGVAGVVINMENRPHVDDDYPLSLFIVGLRSDIDPPVPLALFCGQSTIASTRHSYNLGEPTGTGDFAALQWPPVDEEVRGWLANAVQVKVPAN
ncbi:MAG TPA: hypothetical protein VLG47_04590 [Candidatus Saccharimonadales bacterium]|nr:hypothetical protein [Candidatus Saccharimonadales bacterium]